MYCCESKIEKKVTFILAAAGKGSRMNLNYPKQFLDYKGEPLFYSSLKVAFDSSLIDEIIIVTDEQNLKYMNDFCENKNLFSKVKKIIKGGAERQDSIYNGIMEITNADYVVVHDAARPFLKEKYLKEGLYFLNNGYDGAVIGVKAKDTIKIIDSKNEILTTPSRDFLILVHTPQMFKFNILKEAHIDAKNKKIFATDDSMLVERLDKKVKFIQGDYDNIKITTIEDLKFL